MKDAEGAVRSSEKGGPAAAGAAAEEQQVTRLHVGRLTRNVTEAHVHEIFSTFGKLKVRPQPLPPPSPPPSPDYPLPITDGYEGVTVLCCS